MGGIDRPFVSIVMPVLNEQAYIARAIDTIVPRADDPIDYELMILDGGSTDHTLAIVEAVAAKNPRLRLLYNERRTQAAAMNIAAAAADPRSVYLVRADCHSTYPRGFVSGRIATLREKQVASVVVRMRTLGRTCMQKAIAAAQNSLLGNGGSAHRMQQSCGYVDHGHHAAFTRAAFVAVGGYDESFTHNEDAEFDVRLARGGGRIYLDDVSIDYYPRGDLKSLALQYFSFGWGRASTLVKHRARPRLRQLLPLLVVLGCGGAVLLSIFNVLFLIPVVLYVGVCLLWGAALAIRTGDRCCLASGAGAMVMHFSWGIGCISRVMRLGLDRVLAETDRSLRPSTDRT